MSFRFKFPCAVALLSFAGPVRAGLIDFEAFAPFQNINGLDLGGVTITNPTTPGVVVYDDAFHVGYHSATKAISAPDFMEITPKLVATFDAPKDFVRLWAGLTLGTVEGWWMEAFDAQVGGNSLGRMQSGSWDGPPYRSLEISAPDIWRVEFGLGPSVASGVGFDDLEFTPEPAAIAMLLPLLTMLRWRK